VDTDIPTTGLFHVCHLSRDLISLLLLQDWLITFGPSNRIIVNQSLSNSREIDLVMLNKYLDLIGLKIRKKQNSSNYNIK